MSKITKVICMVFYTGIWVCAGLEMATCGLASSPLFLSNLACENREECGRILYFYFMEIKEKC